MKTTKMYMPVLVTLLLLPVLLKAQQWSAVRWDKTNNFEKVFAATPNTVFVIGTVPVTSEYFILRTNDAGTTWDSIPVNTPGNSFQLRDLFFFDVSNGFIGGTKNTNQVLLKTVNNGNTWTDITPDPTSLNPITSVNFIDAQNGFVTDGTILYITTNGGTNWTSEIPSFIVTDLFFIDINNGYACGSSSLANGVVMKTSDGGQNWSTLLSANDPNLFGNILGKLDFVNSITGFTSLLNTNKLYRTQDGGNSWDTIALNSIQYIRDFDFTSADTGHVLGVFGGGDSSCILITVDGGQNWTLEYSTGWNLYGMGVMLNSFSFIEKTGFSAATNGIIKKYTAAGTGVNEEKLNENISIYPNPSSGKFIVEADNGPLAADKMNLEIYNTLGERIYQSAIQTPQSTIHISSQPSGIYFLNIKTEKESFTQKLIIQK